VINRAGEGRREKRGRRDGCEVQGNVIERKKRGKEGSLWLSPERRTDSRPTKQGKRKGKEKRRDRTECRLTLPKKKGKERRSFVPIRKRKLCFACGEEGEGLSSSPPYLNWGKERKGGVPVCRTREERDAARTGHPPNWREGEGEGETSISCVPSFPGNSRRLPTTWEGKKKGERKEGCAPRFLAGNLRKKETAFSLEEFYNLFLGRKKKVGKERKKVPDSRPPRKTKESSTVLPNLPTQKEEREPATWR